MHEIAWEEKKLDLHKELVRKTCLEIYFIIERHKYYTEMLKTTTERKKLKPIGHITPFMDDYLRNG